MQAYPFDHILCNGRRVQIDDIARGRAKAYNAFESSLFRFAQQWLSGVQEFKVSTSGSTGTPKIISITRHQMIASAQRTAETLGLTSGQSALVCLHPEYIGGKMMIVRCFTSGFRIIATTPSSNPMEHVPQAIDFAALVPLQVHDLLRFNDGAALLRLKTVIVGGGILDPADVDMLEHFPCRFFATYGMTETISHVALRPLNGEHRSGSYFALPGVSFSVDDRNCLIVQCAELGSPVTTNDVVELLDEKHFSWLGRWDNVINSGGIKVIPEKLEATITGILQEAGYHHRFFIAGVPDARLGTKVVMVIEGHHSVHNYSTLTSILKSSLQPYEMPRVYYEAERFDLTETGKINRNATLGLAIIANDSSH